MKLFLPSSLDKTLDLLPDILIEPLKSKRVLFVANAADNETGTKWRVDLDRGAFEKTGCEIIDIDLRDISKENFRAELEAGDILHI